MGTAATRFLAREPSFLFLSRALVHLTDTKSTTKSMPKNDAFSEANTTSTKHQKLKPYASSRNQWITIR